MPDSIEEIASSGQELFGDPLTILESEASRVEFVDIYRAVASHERFKEEKDALKKFDLVMFWAVDKRRQPLYVSGEERVVAFFKAYGDFFNDVLTNAIDITGAIEVFDNKGYRTEAIEGVAELARINQVFSKTLLNTILSENEQAKNSIQVLHSMLVTFHKDGGIVDEIGNKALSLLDGARAQAAVMHSLYDQHVSELIVVPDSENLEEVMQFDVKGHADFVIVSPDGKKVIAVDTKGRYYDKTNLENMKIEFEEVSAPNGRNERFMIEKLNEVKNGSYVSSDAKFVYVKVVVPTSTKYLSPCGEILNQRDRESIKEYFSGMLK